MIPAQRQGDVVISVDASCSGRKATCAAVLMADRRVVAERSRSLPEVDGYVLAAEIGAVALAAELAASYASGAPIVVEIDNPQVPCVLLEGSAPLQVERIPVHLLLAAGAFARSDGVRLCVLPRNATSGLRRADRLARKLLWRRR